MLILDSVPPTWRPHDRARRPEQSRARYLGFRDGSRALRDAEGTLDAERDGGLLTVDDALRDGAWQLAAQGPGGEPTSGSRVRMYRVARRTPHEHARDAAVGDRAWIIARLALVVRSLDVARPEPVGGSGCT